MKVLFAVSNENISTQIVKRYQKEYKEIISYKNMYYFNAIIKELQRDKSYDRIVISEDLEPFANNNIDSIEKFIFEKLDSISDEATGINGKEIPIILLSTDKRMKADPLLVKLFGIGIYNILLGQDRTTDNVCSLLSKPRNKKEAKTYYKIEAEEVNYKSESETNVSESEIKNILNHYRKLGKDEDRYVESFNNIAAQYNDAQLRIITKFLPLNVKAVLEEKSPKYQSVMTFDVTSTADLMKKKDEEEGLKVGFLNYSNANKPTRPVIVPTAVKRVAVKKYDNNKILESKVEEEKNKFTIEKSQEFNTSPTNTMDNNDLLSDFGNIVETEETEIVEPVKRGRGRPRKIVDESEAKNEKVIKRGRGRPRKITEETDNIEESVNEVFSEFDSLESDNNDTSEFEDIDKNNTLYEFDNIEENNEDVLPGFDEIENYDNTDTLPGFDEIKDNDEETLPGFDDIEENDEDVLPGFDEIEENDNTDVLTGFDETENDDNIETLPGFGNINNGYGEEKINTTTPDLLLTNKKVVSFVGTTKNGTSFLVNNIAKTLASMGVKTAILDLTSNRNSYYIYTKNEEKLRNIAYESIKELVKGNAQGISVNQYLDVYTALPGDDELPLNYANEIISTLAQKYSAILIDCDFSTPSKYFEISQEIYIVQTMDILTIQPMTAFLRELKAKEILTDEKIRIIINKAIDVKGLTPRAIIGGLAFYNAPSMSFMTELFNKESAKYWIVPFDGDACAKYLEGVMNCEIKINSYSKKFNEKLKELTNVVYPLLDNQKNTYNNFSSNMNNTLEQMKNKY